MDLATANACRILAVVAPARAPRLARGAAAPLQRGRWSPPATSTATTGSATSTRFVEPDGRPRYPEPPLALEMRDGPDLILDAADRVAGPS